MAYLSRDYGVGIDGLSVRGVEFYINTSFRVRYAPSWYTSSLKLSSTVGTSPAAMA